MFSRIITCILFLFGTPLIAAPYALTDAPTISWDGSNGLYYQVTIAGDRKLAAPTNLVDGADYLLYVDQDSTGSRALSYDETGYLFPNGNLPVLAAGAGQRNLLKFHSSGSKLTFINVTRNPSVVPNAPSGLAATDGTGQVSLAWTDNSAAEDAYRVERWNGFQWEGLGTSDEPANTVSYVDTTAPGTYQYRVGALKNGVMSLPSNVVLGTSN